MHWYRAGRVLSCSDMRSPERSSKSEMGSKATARRQDLGSSSRALHACHYCMNGHHTVCDTLRTTNFHPGGFSEYLRLPAVNVDGASIAFLMRWALRRRPSLSLWPASTGTEDCRHGHRKSVLVIGSGISGLLHIQLAHALGAAVVVATDVSDYRLSAAVGSG